MKAKVVFRWPLIALVIGGIASAQPAPAPAPAQPAPAPAQPAPSTAPAPTPAPAPSGVPVDEGPPTGPGLGVPAGHAVNTTPVRLSAAELKELESVEEDYNNFQAAAQQQEKRMREIARREFDSRTAALEKRYAERISKTEQDRKKLHEDTIALLEAFLQNHPDHPQYTPDAMFRLADLYLDQANQDVDDKLAAQDAATAAGHPPAADAAAITADYSKSIALWQDILQRFPSYRQTAPTMYLLAYYGKTKDERRSLEIFLALACSNHFKWDAAPPAPPSRAEAIKRVESRTLRDPYADCQAYPGADKELVRHAWVRGIADYEFTVPGELDEAIAAYLKVANGGQDSPLFAESLYKLAWSYYKRDFLLDSIKRFDQSVKLYDAIVAKGEQPPLELRDESIQYIAVAFTDPWEGETDTDPVKAFQRAQDFYKGRENEPHVRDVWVALGHAFADLQAWDQAVDCYRKAIGPPWELNPTNPLVHQEIVNVFELKGDKYAADQAAAELAMRYAPGTPWYTANEKDRKAMDAQRRISERALYAAAKNTHAEATSARKDYEASAKKDPDAKAQYLALYSKAVDLYRQFINTYPDSDQVYDFMFLEGEALYYSGRYPEAIQQYKWVRDHRDLGTSHYIDAARSVVQSYEAEEAEEVAAGKLQPLKVPTVAELQATPQPWQPQPIPPLYQELQQEYDAYQTHVQDPQAAPQQGINAALISLAYMHTDDAIARFQKVVTDFCHTPPADPRDPKAVAPASKAKDGILAIYQAENNFDAIQKTNDDFIRNQCGDKASIDLAISQNRSLNFERARDLYAKKQYIPAAEAFYRFYKTAPQTDTDLPTALYNAAVAYKLGDRPKTAIALFQEFTTHPEKNFRESPYYLDAVRLTAATYQAAFDYDDAVKTYKELYAATKKAKKLGIKPPEPLPGEQPTTLDQMGRDAMYNAAFASELNRDFKQAVPLYKQYISIEPDRRKDDRALWAIAGIYRESGDIGDFVDTLDRWRARYGKDPDNADDYVESYYDEAKLWHKKGRTPQARKAEQDTIDAWKKTGSPKNTRGAKLAAEFAIADAEAYYNNVWSPFQITKTVTTSNFKRAKAEIAAQNKQIEKLRKTAEDKYIALDQFGVLAASMCAKVRYGDIQYDRGQKIENIPIPSIIASNAQVSATYQTQRDQALQKDLDEAKADWVDVADKAKAGGVSNEWSQHALENLAREFPDQYHVLRQELVQETDKP